MDQDFYLNRPTSDGRDVTFLSTAIKLATLQKAQEDRDFNTIRISVVP
jgi:hypothetical protein